MHLVILPAVRIGPHALEQRVARISVGGEEGAVGEQDAGVVVRGGVRHGRRLRVRVGVLGEARADVGAEGFALGAVGGLRGQVLGVNGAHDVEAVAVVGGDEDEGVVELVDGGELGKGGVDAVVGFKQFTEGAVVVGADGVHLLVDGCGVGHDEPAFITAAGLDDIDCFEGHLFQAQLVRGRAILAVRGVFVADQVLRVGIAVEPFGHVGDAEVPQRFGVVGRLLQRGVLEHDVMEPKPIV